MVSNCVSIYYFGDTKHDNVYSFVFFITKRYLVSLHKVNDLVTCREMRNACLTCSNVSM